MGLVSSRLNLDSLNLSRRRSQQDETLYTYALNKNFFSNYFFMGGERFEVSDPDYLFGDNCDLNFLGHAKPYTLPYKKAQQTLLSTINTKQKATNKVSNRVNRLSSTFNPRGGREKQDAQTQTLTGSKGIGGRGSEPSQPLVMFINIRKETLRLVKSSAIGNFDSDIYSLNKSSSEADPRSSGLTDGGSSNGGSNNKLDKRRSSWKNSKKSLPQQLQQQTSSNRHSASSSRATTATIFSNELGNYTDAVEHSDNLVGANNNSNSKKFESDVSSLLSATSSIRSGYVSVKEAEHHGRSMSDEDSSDDDDDFKDALNDTTNLSIENEDEDSEGTQQQKSLLSDKKVTPTASTSETPRDVRITIGPHTSATNLSDTIIKTAGLGDAVELQLANRPNEKHSRPLSASKAPTKRPNQVDSLSSASTVVAAANRVYNIEFTFDAEVDCFIRIFYFCTKESTSSGISYKPQHATYRSKLYYYKKGLNQKFGQPDHTFQPYLFDEDLLIYKPPDSEGNYNKSGTVFPIVILMGALEGLEPMQSLSLIATIEKSQLDGSYSIKPVKQLVFVDGVQYIIQEIYGIENKQLIRSINENEKTTTKYQNRLRRKDTTSAALKSKSRSLQSNLDQSRSNLNLSDTASVISIDHASLTTNRTDQNRASLVSTINNQRHKSNENTFECVICMSEERDTMLLPCRHLCLCSSCAQSLRYQANSCPICRCPFRAALNLRAIQPNQMSASTSATRNKSQSSASVETLVSASNHRDNLTSLQQRGRRESSESVESVGRHSAISHHPQCTTTTATELSSAPQSATSSFISTSSPTSHNQQMQQQQRQPSSARPNDQQQQHRRNKKIKSPSSDARANV